MVLKLSFSNRLIPFLITTTTHFIESGRKKKTNKNKTKDTWFHTKDIVTALPLITFQSKLNQTYSITVGLKLKKVKNIFNYLASSIFINLPQKIYKQFGFLFSVLYPSFRIIS